MKNNIAMYVASLTLIAALAVPVAVVAQEQQSHPHKTHHYQIVDLGSTFGGPQSYIIPGSGNAFAGSSVLNNGGTVAGFADTAVNDPFPDLCFWDCNIVHAFLAQSGRVLTDLGALPGGGSSAPVWISGNGLVAGLSENGETDPLYPGLPQLRAVLWQRGTITDLGTLPEGGYQSEASAVNSSGQVVGTAMNTVPDVNSMQAGIFLLWGGDGGIMPPYQYQTRAFLWDKQKGMQDLGTLSGGNDSQAFLINERGQVVGLSYTSSTQIGACAPLATSSFIWEKGKGMTDLGGFGGTCTAAAALNNKGQVVGESFRAGDQAAPAFLWENGSIHELGGSLGGDFTGAFAINDQGAAAGFGYLSGNNTFHATLWKNVKTMTDLGVVGVDSCSYAAAINAGGQIVGSSSPVCDFDAAARAFLWEDGSLFDLNSLVPPASALYLQLTYAINDRGEIAGQGVDASGNAHAFLLVPCDGDHPGVEGCDYSLADESATAAADPAPITRSVPSGRPTVHLLLLLRRTARWGQPFSSLQAVPGSSNVGNAQSSGTPKSDFVTEQKADLLLDLPMSTQAGRLEGYCVVNAQTDELTGGCRWSNGWVCLSEHSSACPTDAKALKPEDSGCGLNRSGVVDVARRCSL